MEARGQGDMETWGHGDKETEGVRGCSKNCVVVFNYTVSFNSDSTFLFALRN